MIHQTNCFGKYLIMSLLLCFAQVLHLEAAVSANDSRPTSKETPTIPEKYQKKRDRIQKKVAKLEAKALPRQTKKRSIDKEPNTGRGMAIASLVLGCTSILLPFLGGILGLLFGILALPKLIKSGESGKGYAIAGISLSILTIFLWSYVLYEILTFATLM